MKRMRGRLMKYQTNEKPALVDKQKAAEKKERESGEEIADTYL
jgi:hypothetical protein